MRFRMIRVLLVIGMVAGFGHGFRTLHRRHEARRVAELRELCAATRPPPPSPPPAAPAPR